MLRYQILFHIKEIAYFLSHFSGAGIGGWGYMAALAGCGTLTGVGCRLGHARPSKQWVCMCDVVLEGLFRLQLCCVVLR